MGVSSVPDRRKSLYNCISGHCCPELMSRVSNPRWVELMVVEPDLPPNMSPAPPPNQ